MTQLIEDAGLPWTAGWVGRWARLARADAGTDRVGGRPVRWALAPGGVSVAHPPADPAGPPEAYSVEVLTTPTPAGGDRWWWACPGCGRRAADLYLPAGRDRLGCRRCCELRYASQYPSRGRRRKRRRKPVMVYDTVERTRWAWSPLAGGLVLAAYRRFKRARR